MNEERTLIMHKLMIKFNDQTRKLQERTDSVDGAAEEKERDVVFRHPSGRPGRLCRGRGRAAHRLQASGLAPVVSIAARMQAVPRRGPTELVAIPVAANPRRRRKRR